MGLSNLCLVAPDQFPHEFATSRAAGADDLLERARVVQTLDEAIADCALVVGTSARGRKIPWPLLNPRECAERLFPESRQHKVALVFGREDRGLTNDELARCHYHVHIPSDPEYSSLNLGAAVQVLSYELRREALAAEGAASVATEWDAEYATAGDVEGYFTHLQQVLEQIGFIDPSHPGQVMTRLRRLYSRQRLDKIEVNMLRGVLSETQRGLSEPPATQAEE